MPTRSVKGLPFFNGFPTIFCQYCLARGEYVSHSRDKYFSEARMNISAGLVSFGEKMKNLSNNEADPSKSGLFHSYSGQRSNKFVYKFWYKNPLRNLCYLGIPAVSESLLVSL